jgi:sugar transferase (PEP-CTERM system associated)
MSSFVEQVIPRRKLMLIGSESFIFTAILYFGTSLWPFSGNSFDCLSPSGDAFRGLLSCFTVGILCQACLSYNDLYDWKVSQNRRELPNRLMHSGGYALVMLSVLVFLRPTLFLFPGLTNTHGYTWKLILLLLVCFVAIFGWRYCFHWFFYKWNFGERVAVLGGEDSRAAIAHMIIDNPMSGFEVVGLVTTSLDERPSPRSTPRGSRVLGHVSELPQICAEHRVARVVVALEERRGKVPVAELLQTRMAGVVVEESASMYERVAGKIAVESLRPSYLIFGHGFHQPTYAAFLKRAIDISVSLTGLVLALPLCSVVMLLIKLTSQGPIFFRQPRVGQEGKTFDVLKFRTMRTDAEKHTGPIWATAKDDRVTKVGRLLRLTRIDEIPQMLNVLAGHMSFVGPRPERPFFVKELSKEIPFYPLRLTVKPGLTGWAQVNHHYGASVEDAIEKLRFDLYYIKHMSPLFDLNIILRTVGVVLFGKGAR